jgi:hypothetical protein
MIEVVWSKIHGTGAEVASCCWSAISESASEGHRRHPHARGTFRAQQGGLKYLVNLVLPRGLWIRTKVG